MKKIEETWVLHDEMGQRKAYLHLRHRLGKMVFKYADVKLNDNGRWTYDDWQFMGRVAEEVGKLERDPDDDNTKVVGERELHNRRQEYGGRSL